MGRMQREQQKAMFARKGGKKRLTSISFNLRTPSKNIRDQIKRKHIDSSGRFRQRNDRHNGNIEKIPLDNIGIFNVKKNQFVLKGTSPSDRKALTKIVTLKK